MVSTSHVSAITTAHMLYALLRPPGHLGGPIPGCFVSDRRAACRFWQSSWGLAHSGVKLASGKGYGSLSVRPPSGRLTSRSPRQNSSLAMVFGRNSSREGWELVAASAMAPSPWPPPGPGGSPPPPQASPALTGPPSPPLQAAPRRGPRPGGGGTARPHARGRSRAAARLLWSLEQSRDSFSLTRKPASRQCFTRWSRLGPASTRDSRDCRIECRQSQVSAMVPSSARLRLDADSKIGARGRTPGDFLTGARAYSSTGRGYPRRRGGPRAPSCRPGFEPRRRPGAPGVQVVYPAASTGRTAPRPSPSPSSSPVTVTLTLTLILTLVVPTCSPPHGTRPGGTDYCR